MGLFDPALLSSAEMETAQSENAIENKWPVLKKKADRHVVSQLRKLALQACEDEVKAFANCASGKLFSVTWKCRGENKAAKECMDRIAADKDLRNEVIKQHALAYPASVVRYEDAPPDRT